MLSSKVVLRLKFLIRPNVKMQFSCIGSLWKASDKLMEVNKNNVPSRTKQKSKDIMIPEAENMKYIRKFLCSVDIPLSSQEKYKNTLKKQQPKSLERRYYCLKEMGFTNITIENIIISSRFTLLMTMTVAELHANGDLAHDVHPLDSLMSIVDGPPNLREIIETEYSSFRDSSLKSIHDIILLEYLSWKLESNREEIVPLFKKYKDLHYTSLHLIMQVCKVLIEDIGIPMEKIKSNGLLLCLHPNEILDKLNQFPTLANIPFIKLIHKYPYILAVSMHTLKKNEHILHHYDISPEQIMKCGEALLLNSEKLTDRLRLLEELPELKAMKINVWYLKLVYCFDLALKRMKYLKANGFPLTLPALFASENYFKIYISSPEDRMFRKKLIEHLTDYFKCDKKIITAKLKNYYVNAEVNSVENIKKILELLKENNFSNEDILNNVSLLLQNYETIKADFDSSAPKLLDKKKNTWKYGRRSTQQLPVDVDVLLKS